MKKLLLVFILINTTSILFSCHSQKNASKKTTEKTQTDFQQQGYESAVVIDKTGLDGCGFLLQTISGKMLEPTNLQSDFKKNNLNVWIKYSIKKNAVSTCMSGQIITLTAIEIRK